MKPATTRPSPRAQISRRRFLQALPLGLLFGKASIFSVRAASATPVIMTVRGPLKPANAGFTLTHEHVLVDFIGADKISADRYDREEAFRQILPHLRQFKKLGGRTLVECTPAYLGRDPLLLERLSKRSGVNLLTNTGYYGAVNNKFLPQHAITETARQLSERWLAEWRQGIAGTGVRPGFIKIGVEGDSLSELHAKLSEAAALTHQGSGLTIASHTGKASLAEKQIAILRERGVAPDAFIFVHAHAEPDETACIRLAKQGTWISYDGFQPENTERYTRFASAMRQEGLLGHLLFSHDAGWFQPGEPGGGEFRPYNDIFEALVPELLRAGLQPSELQQIFVKNPARALAIRIRHV